MSIYFEKIAVENVGCIATYFCCRHTIYGYNFLTPVRRDPLHLSNKTPRSISFKELQSVQHLQCSCTNHSFWNMTKVHANFPSL